MNQNTIIEIKNVGKTYDSGTLALENVSLDIKEGEIFALLGPNGAGKTTLIGIITGVIRKTAGTVTIDGHDNDDDWRKARSLVSLVPQEIQVDIFLTVIETLEYQRGFYGKPKNDTLVEETLKALSLWDKKDEKVQALSGGMKRRVLIAKALMNEPKILFLDEPTAGVDVELRKGMWDYVWELKKQGVTTILTTHYLEEAEMMADRIGVIDGGKIITVDDKKALMGRLGKKELFIELKDSLDTLPEILKRDGLEIIEDGKKLKYVYETTGENPGITQLLADIKESGHTVKDIETKQTSLEEIFIKLIEK